MGLRVSSLTLSAVRNSDSMRSWVRGLLFEDGMTSLKPMVAVDRTTILVALCSDTKQSVFKFQVCCWR